VPSCLMIDDVCHWKRGINCWNFYVSFQEEEAHFMRLVSVLHDLLICKTHNKEKKEELHK
jgi:hypothetical protein